MTDVANAHGNFNDDTDDEDDLPIEIFDPPAAAPRTVTMTAGATSRQQQRERPGAPAVALTSAGNDRYR